MWIRIIINLLLWVYDETEQGTSLLEAYDQPLLLTSQSLQMGFLFETPLQLTAEDTCPISPMQLILVYPTWHHTTYPNFINFKIHDSNIHFQIKNNHNFVKKHLYLPDANPSAIWPEVPLKFALLVASSKAIYFKYTYSVSHLHFDLIQKQWYTFSHWINERT